MEWTPARIRLLRETGLCLPQDKFAKELGFTKRTIGNAERGAHPPGLALCRALDEALESASDVQRTRFFDAVANGQGAAPGLRSVSSVVESIELLRMTETSELGPGTLEQLEELVEQLGVEYLAVPPAEFRETVLSWRRYVAGLLGGRLTLRERQCLYAVAGALTGLLAEVSLALGEQTEPHCTTALSLAQQIGHANLSAWILGTQAKIAMYAGDSGKAVTFAQAASAVAPSGSTARFRACALEARTNARHGDLRETECALSRAEHALDACSEQQAGGFFSFDAPYLPYYAGTAYVWLGEAERARIWASQAIELCDANPGPWPVARTNIRVDLAVALVQAGEHHGAAAVGVEAMDIWAERPTYPARKRIDELMVALRPYDEPCVVELRERWRWISN